MGFDTSWQAGACLQRRIELHCRAGWPLPARSQASQAGLACCDWVDVGQAGPPALPRSPAWPRQMAAAPRRAPGRRGWQAGRGRTCRRGRGRRARRPGLWGSVRGAIKPAGDGRPRSPLFQCHLQLLRRGTFSPGLLCSTSAACSRYRARHSRQRRSVWRPAGQPSPCLPHLLGSKSRVGKRGPKYRSARPTKYTMRGMGAAKVRPNRVQLSRPNTPNAANAAAMPCEPVNRG